MALRRAAGFTLIELIVTIAIVGVMAAMAFPSFTSVIRSNRVATSTNLMLANLAYARSEAIRSKKTATVCASADGVACAADWSKGMLIWTDDDGDGLLSGGEVRRVVQAPKSILLSEGTAASNVAFDRRGRVAGPNPVPHTFSIKPDTCKAGNSDLRTISVSIVGQTTVQKGACS